jgi:hypothetical protein
VSCQLTGNTGGASMKNCGAFNAAGSRSRQKDRQRRQRPPRPTCPGAFHGPRET